MHKPLGMTSREAVDFVGKRLPGAKTRACGYARPVGDRRARALRRFGDSLDRACAAAEKALSRDIPAGAYKRHRRLRGRNHAAHRRARALRAKRLKQAIAQWTGEVLQRPPAYSALRVGGKRAYDLARAGREVETSAAQNRRRIDRRRQLRLTRARGRCPLRSRHLYSFAGARYRRGRRDRGGDVGARAERDWPLSFGRGVDLRPAAQLRAERLAPAGSGRRAATCRRFCSRKSNSPQSQSAVISTCPMLRPPVSWRRCLLAVRWPRCSSSAVRNSLERRSTSPRRSDSLARSFVLAQAQCGCSDRRIASQRLSPVSARNSGTIVLIGTACTCNPFPKRLGSVEIVPSATDRMLDFFAGRCRRVLPILLPR